MTISMLPVVIIPAFSRPKSLQRLLASLKFAEYPSKDTKIIISLDGGFLPDVLRVAESFKCSFSHGKVEIIRRDKNIGLRNHILWCGDQTEIYGAVIVLEDDLIVSRCFYKYSIAAIRYFQDDCRIAGISLYAQKFNEYANLPFEPAYNRRENYFMQVACSWGQVWTSEQWTNFKKWYGSNEKSTIESLLEIPECIKNWPESSWKKYFSAYLASRNKYFVYPYYSYTTNCADVGGYHNQKGSNVLQVPLPSVGSCENHFNFIGLNEPGVLQYDSFMEPINPSGIEMLGVTGDKVAIDFYGTKPIELLKKKEFCITSKIALNPKAGIPLKFKPIESNLLHAADTDENTLVHLTRSDDVKRAKWLQQKKRHFELAKYYLPFRLGTKSLLLMFIFSAFIFIFRKKKVGTDSN